MNDDMNDTLRELAHYTQEKQSALIVASEFKHGELTLTVAQENIVKTLCFLHDDAHCQFKMLMDISGVDYPARAPRFDVVYHLLSIELNQRIRVKVMADEDMPVPSVVPVFPSAGWYEREVWDMYGVFFAGNPDLRRILTDYGFNGHPQRKDFPLTGYVEMRYDDTQKRVVYEPVKLTQAYRSFDYLSPWEGPDAYILPGDEKAKKGAA